MDFIKNMVGKVAKVVKETAIEAVNDVSSFASKNKATLGAFAFLAVLFVGSSAYADTVTLPATGLDIGSYVTAAITALAAVLAVVVGGYFAFLLVKKAMRWAGRALG